MTHAHCSRLAECPCASTMGNHLLRELLDELGWDVPARPDAPRQVWNEALQRVRSRAVAIDLIDAELARLREPIERATWWEYGRRRWIDGVQIAREVAAEKLQAVRDALSDASESAATDGTQSADAENELGTLGPE